MPDDVHPRALIKNGGAYEERFVSAEDGTRLLVRVWQSPDAKGVPVVLHDGLGCHGYAYKYLISVLQKDHPILHWQYRGHGRSDVPSDLDTINLDQLVADFDIVTNAVGLGPAILIGHSMGVQVSLEAWRSFPEKVAGLVLMCGSAGRPLDTFHGPQSKYASNTLYNKIFRRVFPVVAGLIAEGTPGVTTAWRQLIPTRAAYEFAVHAEVNGDRLAFEDFWPYMYHLGNMDPRVFARLAMSLGEHSAEDILGDISLPTLIIGAGKDTFTPIWRSEQMHHAIPQSEYLGIPDGTHTTPIEHPDLVNLRVEKFLRDHFA